MESRAGDPFDFVLPQQPSQPRLDEREAFHQAGELPLVDSGECLAAQPADLAMPPGGEPAAPPGQRPELLVQRFPQTQRCRLGHLLVGCPEGLGAAQERFIQAHERFNQRERGPLGSLLLAGLRRLELAAGRFQPLQGGLGRLLQAAAALGLQLQFVPQRGKGLDQREQARFGERFGGLSALGLGFGLSRVGGGGAERIQLGVRFRQPAAEPVDDRLVFPPGTGHDLAKDRRTSVGRRRARRLGRRSASSFSNVCVVLSSSSRASR